jgi:hypothetical protein
MHDQSNEPPEHRHPELERMIAERYRLLHEVMVTGFGDLLREVRDGFERVNVRFEEVDRRFEHVDRRFDGVEQRLDLIEGHLRRISPNGHQA